MAVLVTYEVGRVTARVFKTYREPPCLVVRYLDRMGFRTVKALIGREGEAVLPTLQYLLPELGVEDITKVLTAIACPWSVLCMVELHIMTIGRFGVEEEDYMAYACQ